MDALFLVNLASTWALVGLVWIIQCVQYPLLAHVGEEAFPHYHQEHMKRITPVVAILMGTELVAAGLLAVSGEAGQWLAIPVAGVWLSTAFIQVPQHKELEKGPAGPARYQAIGRLVRGNWIRTVLWTGRGLGLAALVLGGE